jgi:hypothetical protein
MRVKPVREGRFMITSGSSRSLRDEVTKSGAAAPQSKTPRDARGSSELRQVLECASPLALSCGIPASEGGGQATVCDTAVFCCLRIHP